MFIEFDNVANKMSSKLCIKLTETYFFKVPIMENFQQTPKRTVQMNLLPPDPTYRASPTPSTYSSTSSFYINFFSYIILKQVSGILSFINLFLYVSLKDKNYPPPAPAFFTHNTSYAMGCCVWSSEVFSSYLTFKIVLAEIFHQLLYTLKIIINSYFSFLPT